ncbi:unnamed protein product [Parnassius apollo]|uniref:(apollo) hypothetical protein n=1 Tax=Parnassius apollo TaxID=110799 RepID=A0A8S3YDL2_PARAO|nr:unnamed protein product [Parnassius apollo]
MTASNPPEEKTVDLEDILSKFSISGRYHLQIAALAILVFASNSIYCSNYIFVAEEINYRCTKYSIGDNSSGDCIEWVYDKPDSFVAEFQLANQEWKRTFVGTVHSFGNMVGLFIVGPMSDRFGRTTMLIVTGVLGGVFGLARSFSPWYWLYVAFEFLEASLGDLCSPAYILTLLCISQPLVSSDLPALSTFLYMTGKMMSSFYFSITYLYTSELFPTYTRNSMHAICSSLGRIGSIISPQTPLLTRYWFGLPSLIFGLTSLFAGLVTFLVPDISNDALPDTIREAEELGKTKSIDLKR